MKPLYEDLSSTQGQWYDKTGWVIFWLIFMTPLGLYGLARSKKLLDSEKLFICLVFVSIVSLLIYQRYRESDNSGYAGAKKWYYLESLGETPADITYFAQIESSNLIEFAHEYPGTSDFILSVRKKDATDIVLIECRNCQFLHNKGRTTYIEAVLDGGNSEKYSISPAAEGVTEAILFNSPKQFISNLKKANQLTLTAEFEKNGLKEIKFNVSGLKWNR